MQIGICILKISIPSASTLKEKRQVLNSLFTRIRRKFNVSVTEIEERDSHKNATIAIVSVNTDKNHLFGTLSRVVELMKNEARVVIEDYHVETI